MYVLMYHANLLRPIVDLIGTGVTQSSRNFPIFCHPRPLFVPSDVQNVIGPLGDREGDTDLNTRFVCPRTFRLF